MTRTKIDAINALAELERLGWKFDPLSDDEVKTSCPVHDDNDPSVSLNVKKNLWTCYSCGAKGDIVSFLAHASSVERQTMLVDLSSRYDLEDQKQIDPRVVEKMHAKVWDAGPLLHELRKRGVSDEMIKRARIGYHEGRITIPVYDLAGRVVNIRRYLPGGGAKKMLNTRGYGKSKIYQPDQLDRCESVWICGGELKALVVGSMLAEHSIGACASTGGEGSWDTAWQRLFKGKRVWICMDVDPAGRAAARKLGTLLTATASEVRIVALPLDKDKHPKGDVNDYIGQEGATADDLLRLMELAAPYEVSNRVGVDDERGTKHVTLSRATLPENMGWRLEMNAVVSAEDSTPYLVPNEVDVGCTRDQPNCHICPVSTMESDAAGFVQLKVPSSSDAILEMVGAPKKAMRSATMEGLGVPSCKVAEIKPRSQHLVWDVRLSPELEISGEQAGNIAQPALVVGADAELNAPYIMRGRTYPHPRHQQATLVLDEAEITEDNLSTFKLSEEDAAVLAATFQPKEWTDAGLKEKLDEIYDDLEANVTRIYKRRDLHVAIDLAYHSPLFIGVDGKTVNGWLQVLVVGDSAQGKSETCLTLQRHYGLGEKVECKNATVAGLLGGLQQLGTRWFVSWGVIPTHDRRLVILEELKGASTEVIGRLTDMRSTGMAEIPKIERRRAHARTRLVALSNPRGSRSLSTYAFGLAAIQELVGALEDVRRFDLALVLQSGEVSVKDMASEGSREVPQRHGAEACRKLILWAWTTKDVQWEDGARTELKERAAGLCEKFSEAMPLVDRGTAHHKVSRMAAAIAARTFSRDQDGRLVVRRCHATFVCDYIDRLYSAKAFGYLDFSSAQSRAVTIKDRRAVRRYLINTRHPAHLVSEMLYRDDITPQDVQDWCEIGKDDAQSVVSFLVRNHAIKRRKQTYHKTPDFISLLKEIETENIEPTNTDREDF
tara:strand:+ start:8201 stop:11041 length:2841 start_codon:yes stop_codon:yes gene_type:complete